MHRLQTSKTINPRRLDGLVGQPVDLTEWAYTYRQGAADNPPEAQWLWPGKYMQWQQKWRGPWAFHYCDTPEEEPLTRKSVLAGFLWEQPRRIRQVRVTFRKADGPVPDPSRIAVMTRPTVSMWADSRLGLSSDFYEPVWLARVGAPAYSPQGDMTLTFPGEVPEKVKGTDLGFIYESWIEGIGEFRVTCPDGNYRVTLHFAEMSSLPDDTAIDRPGMRVFAVALQGKTVLTDADPLAMAGGRNVAAARTFQTEVTGGQLVVGFVKKIGEPLLHALEIEQLPPLPEPPPGKKKRAFVLRVNCGGPWWKDGKGNTWQSTRRFVEGGWGTVGGRAVARSGESLDGLVKLYVCSTEPAPCMAQPIVEAFDTATWKGFETIDVHWQFAGDAAGIGGHGRVEAYNGLIESVEPLAGDNGIEMVGPHAWRQHESGRNPRGIRLRVLATAGPRESGTLITLRTAGGDVTFAVRDLEDGPILVPSVGVFVSKADSGITVRQFQEKLAVGGRQTLRRLVAAHPEQTLRGAMRSILARDTFPEIPAPPADPPLQIEIPEIEVQKQFALSAWHVRQLAKKLSDGTWCISIWPEFDTAIGAESYQIIRTLDLLGLHDIAAGGLDYWLHRKHEKPFAWFADVLGDDALCTATSWPGYDEKHGAGHGMIMQAAALHYRLTGDEAWLRRARPVLKRACAAAVRLREAWMARLPRENWCYGLMPPFETGDITDARCCYYLSHAWYAGLQAVAAVLEGSGDTDARRCEQIQDFRQSLRKAMERTIAVTPVVRVRDGTYRRYLNWQPYLRGMTTGMQFGHGIDGAYVECIAGGLRYVPDVFQPQEPIVQELLDVYEDVILIGELASDKPRPMQRASRGPEEGGDWFSWTGFGPQMGHEYHLQAKMRADEVPALIRSLYNSCAAEIDPDAGYTFWEGPFKAGATNKTFEAAAFLEHVRNMLVLEMDDTLWLARATPRAWLEQGKKISVKSAPTYYGTVAYEIVSDVDNGKISATVEMPARLPAPDKGGQAGKAPKEVVLRFRHPKSAPIKALTVNGPSTGSGQGKPWTEFNPKKETITLKGLTGTVAVTAQY